MALMASRSAFAARPVAAARAFGTARPRVSIVVPTKPLIVCQAAATAEAPAQPAKKVHPSPLTIAAPPTYAVVAIGGTQMFVEPGKWYTCNRLKAEVGSKIKFGRVLALKHDGKFTVGKPYLDTVAVEAEVIDELRGPKVIVYKMRPKKHYRRKQGHRQELTKFMVTKIAPQ
jgi:large subunit ribosomal protein L21